MATMDSIRASLEVHNAAFEHLVELIPARHYHGMQQSRRVDVEDGPAAPVKKGKQAKRRNIDRPAGGPMEGLSSATTTPGKPSLSRTELQAKLHKRIAELKRPGHTVSDSPAGSASPAVEPRASPSPSSSRDALLEERRLKRGQMRDRRRNERKAERRKAAEAAAAKHADRPQKGNGRGNLVKGGVHSSGIDGGATAPANRAVQSGDEHVSDVGGDFDGMDDDMDDEAAPTAGPSLSYSTLTFSNSNADDPDSSSRPKKRPSKLSKDPALAKVALERREAYLSKLNPEQRERAVDSALWDKANLHATGQKVMDDPKLLAKALKRQEKERKKKREAWKGRVEAERQGKEDRQKKRNDNIEKRKHAMAAKRMGKKAPKERSSGSKLGKGFAKGKGKKPGHRKPVKGF